MTCPASSHTSSALSSGVSLRVRSGQGRAVQFHDVKIHFANVGVQDVQLRKVVQAGQRTRVIDLKGDDRTIEKIVMVYDAKPLAATKAPLYSSTACDRRYASSALVVFAPEGSYSEGPSPARVSCGTGGRP